MNPHECERPTDCAAAHADDPVIRRLLAESPIEDVADEVLDRLLLLGDCPNCGRDPYDFEPGEECATCGFCPRPALGWRGASCADL